MSNVIKSRFIYVNDSNKKIIDSNEKCEKIRLVNLDKQLETCGVHKETASGEKEGKGSFTEGLKATVIDKVSSKEEEKLVRQQNDRILEEARKEAAQILAAAKLDAEKASELICEEARKNGYEDGLQKSMEKIQEKQTKLDQLIDRQNQEYLAQINNLEPQFTDIVSLLVEKITGIVVEDKKHVIQYLIHNAIMNTDNSRSYVIRVSKEDYEFVLSKKEELGILVKDNAVIDVTLDKDLDKNQCMIETDTGIIDCSLDIQLSNLIQDIKLLSIRKE